MPNPTPTPKKAEPTAFHATAGGGAGPDKPAASYTFLQPPQEPDEIGRVGHYRVLRLLGEGGMGMVFAAEDVALRRKVAIKVMHPDAASDAASGWQRFLREARALAGIKHENLVTIYQVFQERGSIFLVMELLEGEPLDAVIRRPKRPDPGEVMRLAGQIAAGLEALHDAGLIHRDIKPGNIWLERKPERKRKPMSDTEVVAVRPALPTVKILDLGLVQATDEPVHLTETGMVVGTPAYMSPEQIRGKPLDHRTDLFSFGCVLYALCTGRLPFQADTPLAQAAALASETPPLVRELNPTVPKGFSDLIAELLAKKPDNRPASAGKVIERLRQLQGQSQSFPVAVTPDPEDEHEPDSEETDEPDPMTEPIPREKTARGEKRDRKPKESFAKRHATVLVLGLWVVVVGLVVIVVVGKREKTTPPLASNVETQNAPVKPSPQKEKDQGTQPKVVVSKSPDAVYLAEFDASRILRPPIPLPPPPPDFDGTVRVGSQSFGHGILMHPGPAEAPAAHMGYKLNKEFSRFTARVAFNNTSPPFAPSVRFLVYLDGVSKWDSGPLGPRSAPAECDLNVKDVTELRLEVRTEARDPRGAHSAWLDPRVTK